MTPSDLDTLVVATVSLTKCFGDRTVVDNLDLAIPTGSVCGFVGPNGAGKTTTIRMLLGLIRPTAGTGTVLGGDLAVPSSYLARVGALIESPAFYPQLSGRDNLVALARLGRVPEASIEPALDRVGLTDRAGDRFRTYSLGMKQRLGIAAALLADPSLLLLDEPTNGLDPAGIVEMRGLVRSLVDEGITIFVSSHLLAEIAHICDHLVMIRNGRSVFQGSVDDLRLSQRSSLVIRPDRPELLGTLARLVSARGLHAEIEAETGSVLAHDGMPWAGELNRAAIDADITIVHLAERERSLEDVFFTLTGTHSGDTRELDALGEIA